MDLSRILDFAEQTDLTDLLPLLRKEVACNRAIAEEGLKNRWGAGIGATLLEHSGDEVGKLACAYAAAGSDARMGGCTLPVIINSGSGNQGLTASLPVIMYAEFYRRPEEQMYRALIVSNLVAIYQKPAWHIIRLLRGGLCSSRMRRWNRLFDGWETGCY